MKPKFFWRREDDGAHNFIIFRQTLESIVPIAEFNNEADTVAEILRWQAFSEEQGFAEYLKLGMNVISERLWR